MGRAGTGGVIALALLLPVQAQAQAPTRVDAEVRAPGDGALLYREQHWLEPAGGRRLVLYRCVDGRAFARKWVQAGALPWAPDYRLEDARGGYRERVQGGGDRRQIQAGTAAAATVAVPGDGVIDAGFDAAVRDHWDALAAGRSVRLQFLLPTRARFVPVRLQRIDGPDWRQQPALRLRMRLDAWFGFALPEVELVYARADRRLLEFDGTGNLRDRNGRNPQVRIAFAAPPRPADAEQLAAAARAPLQACAGGAM